VFKLVLVKVGLFGGNKNDGGHFDRGMIAGVWLRLEPRRRLAKATAISGLIWAFVV